MTTTLSPARVESTRNGFAEVHGVCGASGCEKWKAAKGYGEGSADVRRRVDAHNALHAALALAQTKPCERDPYQQAGTGDCSTYWPDLVEWFDTPGLCPACELVSLLRTAVQG